MTSSETLGLPAEMKANRRIFAPLCLLLCWMRPVGSKTISPIVTLQEPSPDIPLSISEHAVDDMFFNCKARMEQMVNDKYFKEEEKGIFGVVWKQAERCASRNLKRKDKEDDALTKNHMQAICAYTSEYQMFYKTFNNAVRTNKTIYGTYFPFHSLHFWLTSAIQILSSNRVCSTTYRGTDAAFTAKDNEMIRFGSFTSTSKISEVATSFGNKTCFKIKTCLGAFLKKYSTFKDGEQEVLIPPYEIFNLTKEKFVKNLTNCEVAYTLESVGGYSSLNCHELQKGKRPVALQRVKQSED